MRRLILALLIAAPAAAHPPAGVPPSDKPTPPRSPVVLGDHGLPLEELQHEIAREKLDGWLLTDLRGQDDLAESLVRPHDAPARRWFYLIPATGEPELLGFAGELDDFDGAPGKRRGWPNWRALDGELRGLLKGRKRVAMDFAPRPQAPQISRVDAGTVDQVRGCGAQVVPAGELIAFAFARWSEHQRAEHLFALRQLEAIKEEAFHAILDGAQRGRPLDELSLEGWIARALAARGLETEWSPTVAAGTHTADPDYRGTRESSAPIRTGDLVRIEIAARQMGAPEAVYADATWTGFVGDELPEKVRGAAGAVLAARKAALDLVKARVDKKAVVRGFEVDQAAHAAAEKAQPGAAKWMHRAGHSLDQHRFGDGADLDDTEAHEERMLGPHTGYALAPGMYLPGELGVRSGICFYVGDGALEVTSERVGDAVELIRRGPVASPLPGMLGPATPAPPTPKK